MKNIISLKILTPEKTVYSDDVLKVVVTTESGEIGILPDHSPLVSIIKSGEIKIEKIDGEIIPLSVDTGTIKVSPHDKDSEGKTKVIILASKSELATEIDIQRAEEAYERAQKAMKEAESLSDIDFAKFQAILDKELNRIKVGRKYKR